MPFISPMLAKPLPKKFKLESGVWAAEEKYDGHRLIVEVSDTPTDLLTEGRGVTAWSRYGKVRELPRHLIDDLVTLPSGIYDGELHVPGGRSNSVTDKELANDRHLTLFDILRTHHGETCVNLSYERRRQQLRYALHMQSPRERAYVHLAGSVNVANMSIVEELRDAVWNRGGEGLILKRRHASYEIGKRSAHFVKIKELRSACLTIVGFTPSQGEIVDRGPYGVTVLEDEDGIYAHVKTLNNSWLSRVAANPNAFIGRKLWIEYQYRTDTGLYQSARWDHFEDETGL